MRQTAMSQGVCIASSRAIVAAAAAAAALQQPAAGHHEEYSEGQATNSACHSTESLVVALASTTQSDHTCSLCDAVNCHNSIAWLSAALLTTDRYSLPHHMPHRCSFCLLARGLDSVASNKS